MPGVGPSPSGCHGDSILTDEGSDAEPGDEVRDSELLQDSSPYHFVFSSTSLEPNGEENQRGDDSWSQDGGPQGELERRWSLWHQFMKEHAHLDAWLRLAEQAVDSQSSAHITYTEAKEELRKFERLRREAASRLVQLDSLTQKNRTLARLFQGAMAARLLASTRECGRRWDDVNVKLESITGRLQLFVSEWEEFEAQREELAVWLADMDVRLTAVDHLTGNACEKLRQLQSFQDCVCENSCRVNALLQRGEALIQHSEPSDAQWVETGLEELLQRCNYVYNNIARTHTRLLSMRLVFEDDCILSQAPDSGCPSETLPDEEGALDKHHLDVPAQSTPSGDLHPLVNPSSSPLRHPPPPPSRSSPTHEHLEWDPSVDIGHSVSCDETDSSYFSVSTGLGHRDGQKRWSYLSSFDSDSDVTNQEADVGLDRWPDPSQRDLFSLGKTRQEEEEEGEEKEAALDQWMTSTPDRLDGEPVGFDGGRVKAWLRVQSSAPLESRTSCSRAVQTDRECRLSGSHVSPLLPQLHISPRCHDATQPLPASSSSSSSPPSHDLEVDTPSDWMTHGYRLQDEEETSEHHLHHHHLHHLSELSGRISSPSSSSSPSSFSPALLCLLLAAALALLTCYFWVVVEPPCHRSNRMHQSFHVSLRYVNGPPPT
ncbi:uncharacterized protein si:ch211-137a8.2 [Mugil cephalus]|uniref:uncharacterized protein si:ch211-137a8.2 n=1 Tax=Mugil cephalus TaxID=48193 RepID=UPI001FB58D63|nr:uncharacterized protein si:ch211-137a8.2 [Mugil cephalus]XP_047451063.1 uncharacterized protein si:ch211-137a8.2 [Mugil cephalus]